MCQSRAEGGKRCAAHTRGAYQQAWDEYCRGRNLTNDLKLDHPEVYMGAVSGSLRKAAAAYASCAEGGVRVLADLHHAEAKHQDDLADLLRKAIYDAKSESERRSDIAKALAKGA